MHADYRSGIYINDEVRRRIMVFSVVVLMFGIAVHMFVYNKIFFMAETGTYT